MFIYFHFPYDQNCVANAFNKEQDAAMFVFQTIGYYIGIDTAGPPKKVKPGPKKKAKAIPYPAAERLVDYPPHRQGNWMIIPEAPQPVLPPPPPAEQPRGAPQPFIQGAVMEDDQADVYGDYGDVDMDAPSSGLGIMKELIFKASKPKEAKKENSELQAIKAALKSEPTLANAQQAISLYEEYAQNVEGRMPSPCHTLQDIKPLQ
jgi:hypothetical protein